MEDKINYFEKFVEYLKGEEDLFPEKKSSECNLFRHLIQMMGEKIFNNSFKYCFIDHEFEEGFFILHKSMRQNDFFNYDILEGHLDMVFWHFIYISDIPEEMFKKFIDDNYKNDWKF